MLCSQGYASTILNYFQMINCSYYICREALQFYFSYIYLFCFFPWKGRDNCVVGLCRMHANIFPQALFKRLCFSSDLGIPEATNMHSNLCSWQAAWWNLSKKSTADIDDHQNYSKINQITSRDTCCLFRSKKPGSGIVILSNQDRMKNIGSAAVFRKIGSVEIGFFYFFEMGDIILRVGPHN